MESDTLELLERWHAGDRAALDALIQRDLPWVEAHVRRRLGKLLRAKAETQDYVQQALVEFLEYGPRFVIANRRHFRALLARIAENVLRGAHDHFTAQRRAAARERPLAPDSVLVLDPSLRQGERPSEAAEAAEWRDVVRLALELLEPQDRDLILWRDWEGEPFARIGERLGVSADAARMRYYPALARLGAAVTCIREGRLGELLENGEVDD